jgi:hypothetical protein
MFLGGYSQERTDKNIAKQKVGSVWGHHLNQTLRRISDAPQRVFFLSGGAVVAQ